MENRQHRREAAIYTNLPELHRTRSNSEPLTPPLLAIPPLASPFLSPSVGGDTKKGEKDIVLREPFKGRLTKLDLPALTTCLHDMVSQHTRHIREICDKIEDEIVQKCLTIIITLINKSSVALQSSGICPDNQTKNIMMRVLNEHLNSIHNPKKDSSEQKCKAITKSGKNCSFSGKPIFCGKHSKETPKK